jgi:D-alanine-D-alanine ligase
MNRIRVAVIRGGLSDEYHTSLWTGASVLENIDRDTFDPVDIVITKSGEWLVDGRVRMPESILHTVDVVFNALHGTYGEDGTIQRLFDRYGVPYTGSRAFSSGIAMHKGLTKKMLKDTDIKTPSSVQVSRESLGDLGRVVEKITDTFGPQYIIKPVSSGSSVGTMSVKNPLLLQQALNDALGRYEEVMVEVKVPGREATCGVVDRYRDTHTYALPPVEIVLPKDADYFSTEMKQGNIADTICPSRFDRETKDTIERMARLVHTALDLSQYSRSDFIIAEDGVYFLEVNTLPALAKESLFPKSLEAVGASYTDFITHLLTDALRTHRRYGW